MEGIKGEHPWKKTGLVFQTTITPSTNLRLEEDTILSIEKYKFTLLKLISTE